MSHSITFADGKSSLIPTDVRMSPWQRRGPVGAVGFASSVYIEAEGDTLTFKITLHGDPERAVTISMMERGQGNAQGGDFTYVLASVTLQLGRVGQADLPVDVPNTVALVTKGETAINIIGDEPTVLTVNFGTNAYIANEGGTATIKVRFSVDR